MAAKDLKPGLYNHGQDFFLTNCSDGERPINFIDPGHANLMYGVYDDPRKKKFDPMDKTNRWHLTNARYQTETGQRISRAVARLLSNPGKIESHIEGSYQIEQGGHFAVLQSISK